MRHALLLCLTYCCVPFLRAAESDRPNIIVILGEAQGWASTSVQMDESVPESKNSLAHTPALQRLASQGARFANFYAASPRCTPTRAALFTGKSPAALHMTFVGESKKEEITEAGRKVVTPRNKAEMPESEVTIGKLLKGVGYATAHFGKWHAGRMSPVRHGFDENDGANTNIGPDGNENPNPEQAFAITEKGKAFMEKQVREGRPFYLQLSHYGGNGDASARPATYADVRRRAKLGEEKRVDAVAMTEDMDAAIGLLLAKVDELGITKKTVVIYTSDHGGKGQNANGPLSNGKGSVWEGGIRVPLLISGPGVKPGVCVTALASTVDIFPTVAAMAGIQSGLPPGLEGGNLGPLLAGSSGALLRRAREEFVVHFPHYDKGDEGPASVLIHGHDKLIHSYEDGRSQLFNLLSDRSERRDLSAQEPDKTRRLEQRLSDYLQAVGAQVPSPNAGYDPAAPQPSKKKKERDGAKKKEAA